jgi:hypothetical protein
MNWTIGNKYKTRNNGTVTMVADLRPFGLDEVIVITDEFETVNLFISGQVFSHRTSDLDVIL